MSPALRGNQAADFAGKFHFWIDLVTKALRKGALADSFNRFPFLAWVFKTLFSGAIDALVRDTRIHESHTIALIERYYSLNFQFEFGGLSNFIF